MQVMAKDPLTNAQAILMANPDRTAQTALVLLLKPEFTINPTNNDYLIYVERKRKGKKIGVRIS